MAGLRARRIGRIDAREVRGFQLDVDSCNGGFHVSDRRRAYDRRGDAGLGQCPSQSDLRGLVAALPSNLGYRSRNVIIRLTAIELVRVVIAPPPRRCRASGSPLRSTQISARHRTVRNEPDTLGAA